jgi:cytochrome P450
MQRHESEIKVEGISERTSQDQMAILLQASHSGKSDTPYTLLAPVRDRIKQMCQSIIAAGSDTTGTTLTALFYFVLHDKGAMNQLMEEVELNASSIGDNDNGSFSLQTASQRLAAKQGTFAEADSSSPRTRFRPVVCLT